MNTRSKETVPANSIRQLGAAVYDGLLILAVFMVVTFVPVALTGHDLSESEIGPVWHAIHQAVLSAVLALYYGYAWTRRGQTLGMKAWKIRIVGKDYGPLNWKDSFVRLVIAATLWLTAIVGVIDYMHRHDRHSLWALLPLLINYLAIHFPGGLTLTDRVSKTRIMRE
jgi:uncharacterized RDD family membrane protein YckC